MSLSANFPTSTTSQRLNAATHRAPNAATALLFTLALCLLATPALAQDPTAAFTARVTQVEQVSSIIASGVLGVVDLWVLTVGAMKGNIQWPWVILITIVALIVGSYTTWKPLLIS